MISKSLGIAMLYFWFLFLLDAIVENPGVDSGVVHLLLILLYIENAGIFKRKGRFADFCNVVLWFGRSRTGSYMLFVIGQLCDKMNMSHREAVSMKLRNLPMWRKLYSQSKGAIFCMAATKISKNNRQRDPYLDRRSGEDRREAYNADYFEDGGEERRKGKERRKGGERRNRCVKVSKWTSVCPDEK